MFDRIVIIGNGFDRFWGLPTSYVDFEKYITRHYPENKNTVERFYYLGENKSSLWCDFERHLADVDKEYFLDYTTNVNDSEYLYGDMMCAKRLLREMFENWINSIDCSVLSEYSKPIDNAFIISFNYTETLERNFGVQYDGIYHIHGVAKGDIIFGHKQGIAYQERVFYPQDAEDDKIECGDIRPLLINWLNEYYKLTEKPIDRIISNSEDLLQNQYNICFSVIKEITVIGHSYSEIDLPYFEWMANNTNASWKLGFFSDTDKDNAIQMANQLNISQFDVDKTAHLIEKTFH